MKRALGIALVTLGLLLSRARGEDRDEPDADLPDPIAQVKPDYDGANKSPAKDKKAPPKKEESILAPLLAEMFAPPEEPDLLTRELPSAPEMQGDVGPAAFIPPAAAAAVAKATAGAGTAPSGKVALLDERWFKIADNSSPRPQDRVFFSFNFYDDLNRSLNQRLGAPVGNMRLYRETFGFEKTFFGGATSIDMRLPLNSLSVGSPVAALGGSNTALGDVVVILKYAPYRDIVNDNFYTVGLAVIAPTGPNNLAGFFPAGATGHTVHDTLLQPYIGALQHWRKMYIQGFSALDAPTSSQDVTLWYNDLGVGYFAYWTPNRSRWVTAVVPTFETHITTPLDHRGSITTATGVIAFDTVNLGAGTNVQVLGRGWFNVGVVTPVTGPKPFSVEALAQFRLWF
jgi:hypothetical protein